MLVYPYNGYMNRSKKELETKNKVNIIVRDKLPKFASRYFKANMETKSLQSLYGYALDLTSFFEYLKYREPESFDIARMTISDLNELSPSAIEDYLNYSRIYTDKGETKTRSDATIKRRYSSLSSFIAYYYKYLILPLRSLDVTLLTDLKSYLSMDMMRHCS